MKDIFNDMFVESIETVDQVIDSLDIDWDDVDFTPEDVKKGYEVEREHSDTVDNDTETMVKISIDHLTEFPSYYTELAKMEKKLKESIQVHDITTQYKDTGQTMITKKQYMLAKAMLKEVFGKSRAICEGAPVEPPVKSYLERMSILIDNAVEDQNEDKLSSIQYRLMDALRDYSSTNPDKVMEIKKMLSRIAFELNEIATAGESWDDLRRRERNR